MVWLKCQRLAIDCFCFFKPAQAGKQIAQIVEGVDVIRLQRQGFSIRCLGRVELSAFVQEQTEVVMSFDVIRADRDDPPPERLRIGKTPALKRNRRLKIQRAEVIGLLGEYAIGESVGGAPPSGLIVRSGLSKKGRFIGGLLVLERHSDAERFELFFGIARARGYVERKCVLQASRFPRH